MRSGSIVRHSRHAHRNPHIPLSHAFWRSVACRLRSFVPTRRAPSPGRGTGHSGRDPRPWAGYSARSARQHGARRSAGGRTRAVPRGTPRRRSGCPTAGGNRRTCRAPPPSTPSSAACRLRGRHGGTARDRGRRTAFLAAWLWHGGRGRRRGASRRNRCTPSGRARGEAWHSACIRRWQDDRHGVDGGGDLAPALRGP